MNVFEDLITELKEENLLEHTVIDSGLNGNVEIDELEVTEVPNARFGMPESASKAAEMTIEIDGADKVELDEYDAHLHDTVTPGVAADVPKKPANGQEFYRKRAMAEVSNLQMVEHVLTGVEREYMKIVPNIFEDFNAKKALNRFLQVTGNENSSEHQEAEFDLIQETEAWCTALENRDRKMPVSNLRQYCETSRPPLSSQALVALARFYRNLPYSEGVRSKFDFVITRLFSRPTESNLRTSLFTREEMLAHINTLYGEWSSVALYSVDEDESNIMLASLSFEDLAIEAENASTFDQLIEKDFFGRLRQFKGSISELFYAPSVAAAAIDANVRIGNAYVTLIDRERRKMDAETIHSKYGDLHDESVSDGASRTLDLVDLLRSPLNDLRPVEKRQENDPVEKSEPAPAPAAEPEPAKPVEKGRLPFLTDLLENAWSVNKWFLGVCLLLIAGSIGISVYSTFFISDRQSSVQPVSVDLEDTNFKEYVSTGRIISETFYGLVQPAWDNLPKERRLEVLKNIYQTGTQKGYTQVNLIGKDGRSAAFASKTRLDVIMP